MIYIEGVTSDIVEDNYTGGEGASTGCGLDLLAGVRVSSKEEMYKWLAKNHDLSPNASDYDDSGFEDGYVSTSKTVADHSQEQNGGWFEPTQQEWAAWRKGQAKLYSEYFTVRFHFIQEAAA